VSMKFLAGCFCVCAVALAFLSVGGVTEARSTASEPARKKGAATGRGKPGDAIRQLRVAVPCMPNEIAATVLDSDT